MNPATRINHFYLSYFLASFQIKEKDFYPTIRRKCSPGVAVTRGLRIRRGGTGSGGSSTMLWSPRLSLSNFHVKLTAKGLFRNLQLLSGCRKNTVVFHAGLDASSSPHPTAQLSRCLIRLSSISVSFYFSPSFIPSILLLLLIPPCRPEGCL